MKFIGLFLAKYLTILTFNPLLLFCCVHAVLFLTFFISMTSEQNTSFFKYSSIVFK